MTEWSTVAKIVWVLEFVLCIWMSVEFVRILRLHSIDDQDVGREFALAHRKHVISLWLLFLVSVIAVVQVAVATRQVAFAFAATCSEQVTLAMQSYVDSIMIPCTVSICVLAFGVFVYGITGAVLRCFKCNCSRSEYGITQFSIDLPETVRMRSAGKKLN